MSAPAKRPAPVYSVDYVNGRERLPVYSYNRASKVFVPTQYASGRASLGIANSGWFQASIGGTPVMSVTPEGQVRAVSFSYRRKPNTDYPRLEFVRRVNSIRSVVGSVSQGGKFTVYQLRQEPVSSTTDQMLFMGGALISDDIFSGLTLDMPRNPPGSGTVSAKLEDSDTLTLGGSGQYILTLRFQGEAETREYTGGSASAESSFFYTSSAAQPENPRNIWRLTVSSPEQTFYLNHQAALAFLTFDYQISGIVADAGADIELYCSTVDMLQIGDQSMSVSLVAYSPVDSPVASLGPNGLAANEFFQTADIVNTYLLAAPGGQLIMAANGNRIVIPQ